MKKILSITALVLCLAVFCSCNAKKNTADEEKTISVTTPYAELKVPESFKDNVIEVVKSENPYTMSFIAKADNTELFTLIFNGTGDVLMGTLVGKDSNTVIYFNMPELDNNNSNYQTYCGYQEGINTIMNNLAKDYDFRINELVEVEDNSTYDIQTSLVTLKYPTKWKDQVQVEVMDNGVKFSNEGTPLFDLMFTQCDGYLLGTYKDTPIYIIDYSVNNDTQAAMQEDVNVILQHLMEDSNFKISETN